MDATHVDDPKSGIRLVLSITFLCLLRNYEVYAHLVPAVVASQGGLLSVVAHRKMDNQLPIWRKKRVLKSCAGVVVVQTHTTTMDIIRAVVPLMSWHYPSDPASNSD